MGKQQKLGYFPDLSSMLFTCQVFATQLQGTWGFCMFSEWIPPASSPPGHGGVLGAVAIGAGAGRLKPGPAPALVCSVLLITHQRGCRAGGNEGNEVNMWKCFLVFPLGAQGPACWSLAVSPSPGCGWAQGLDGSSERAQFGEKCGRTGVLGMASRDQSTVKACLSCLEGGRRVQGTPPSG